MMIRRLTLTLLLLTATAFATGCANLCERKDSFFSKHCVGTGVTYSPDPLCQHNLDNCNEGQLAQFEAYVECLESANVCSMEVVSQCAAQHPGGVNLQCQKRSS